MLLQPFRGNTDDSGLANVPVVCDILLIHFKGVTSDVIESLKGFTNGVAWLANFFMYLLFFMGRLVNCLCTSLALIVECCA